MYQKMWTTMEGKNVKCSLKEMYRGINGKYKDGFF